MFKIYIFILILMSIRICFKGTNKKLPSSSANNYSEFLQKLKKLFGDLKQPFSCLFVTQKEKIHIYDDTTLIEIKNKSSIGKVIVVQEGDEELSFVDDPFNMSTITELAESSIKNQVPMKQPQKRKEEPSIDYQKLKSVNYLDAIYTIFDPDYKQTNDDYQIKPWIKLEDLHMNSAAAATEIWKASEKLIKKMTEDDDF